MRITDTLRTRIIAAMRLKSLTQAEIAEHLGYKKSWATRLLNGTLKTLTAENVDKLESLLGIEFFRIAPSGAEVSGLGLSVSEATENNPDLANVIESVLELSSKCEFTPPYHTTKQLVGLGKELERFVFANEGKPEKIGRFAIEMMSQDPNKRKKKRERYPTAKPEG